MGFDIRRSSAEPDVIAPDGSEVRLLCASARGSMALFTLRPGVVARAVTHRTVDEIWYVVAGAGRIWRRLEGEEAVTALTDGVSLTIPTGTSFQFRCDSAEPLSVIGVTMPPWPGQQEAAFVDGPWSPTA
ncbi:MAG TPA: cupin domain-containing protein [Acetobacteraceae bacterium]|nr:cupin domain-containing protein [Acetobacteraceae bacterium]